MSSTESDRPNPFAVPRPGVVKTLGICNVVFSLLLSLCLLSSAAWIYMAMIQSKPSAAPSVVTAVVTISPTTGRPTPPPSVTPPVTSGPRPMLAIDPFVGMNDPNMLRFSIVDSGTAFLLNGLMFATGIGLINVKRWGVRWWTYVAWIKILRLWLFWGFFIVAVAPGFSEVIGRDVAEMFKSQGGFVGECRPLRNSPGSTRSLV